MVLFKDINKASTDLLKEDFPHDKPWQAELKRCVNNMEFTQTALSSSKGAFDGTSRIKFQSPGKSVLIDAKFQANAAVTVDAYLKRYMELERKGEKFPAMSLLNAKVDYNKLKVSPSAELAAEFVTNSFHNRLSVSPNLGLLSYSTNLLLKNRLVVGGEVTSGLDLSGMKYSLGTSYVTPEWELSAKTLPTDDCMFGKIVGNFYSTVLPGPAAVKQLRNTAVAAQWEFNIKDQKSNFQFGAMTSLYSDTAIKAKVSDDGKVALSLAHELAQGCTAIFGVEGDALTASKESIGSSSADSLRWGLSLKFKQK